MTPAPTKTIDFLPDKYRQASKRRRVSYWRAVITVMFLAVFATCAVSLKRVENAVRREHEQVSARHASAVEFEAALKAKEERLAELSGYADLITFLRHPWPRSRLIHELFIAVPGSVTIESLRVVHELRPTSPDAAVESSETTADGATMSAAADLAQLRSHTAARDLVIHLEGASTDIPGLHAYLHRLSQRGLFAKAEIERVEAVRDAGTTESRFAARILVRAGWGLPGGPEPSEAAPAPENGEPAVALNPADGRPTEIER